VNFPFLPWTGYFLGTLVADYREFEERVGTLTTARGAKTELVLAAIRSRRGEILVGELQQQCPNVGLDLTRRVLRRERDEGHVECPGRGPDARWRAIFGTIPIEWVLPPR
jgi:hypothetical protein